MRRDGIGLGRAAMMLVGCAVLPAGYGGSDEPAPRVLRLSVVTAPGIVEFDKERLSARAGRIAFVLTNGKRRGHNRELSGFACMGGNDLKLADTPPPPPGAPVVRVRAWSVMGGTDVKRKR